MIQTAVLLNVREEFARRAKHREEDRVAKDRDFVEAQKRRKEEREARDENHDDADLLVVVVMASDDDISLAMAERDIYDVATVEALMENAEAMEEAERQVRVLLDQAYVLPDGRRVFKTEDGRQVFDEHGVEVTDFDPAEIEDWRPHWEAYGSAVNEVEVLAQEQAELLAYQSRLDDARDRLDAGEISEEDLNQMMSGLREDMPEAVRAHLPEDAAAGLSAERTATPELGQPIPQPLPSARLDMPSL